MNIRCPDCGDSIGNDDYAPAFFYFEYHASFCEATEDEREAARIRRAFDAITKDISL